MSDESEPPDSSTDSSKRAIFESTTFSERAHFEGMTFSELANFKGMTFSKEAIFEDVTFSKGVIFEGATFSKEVNFKGTTFSKWVNFEGTTFNKWANFESAIFSDWANFEGTIFSRGASFEGATFSKGVIFEDSIFSDWARFVGTTFSELANFKSAIFNEGAHFESTIFSEGANFEGVTFSKWVVFKDATFNEWANFINSEMKSTTIFDNASFLHTPPLFDGAKLHESTTWFSVTWPRSPITEENARLTVRAYERLKLEMDKLKKHEDELNFFALELQARSALAGGWLTAQGLATCIYGLLCDYGRSYSRPLCLLGVITILGAGPFLIYFGIPGWRGSLALSAANTFGVLGLRREFLPPSFILNLPRMLKLLSAMQTAAGAVLFFLFGLSLRNRFRMR